MKEYAIRNNKLTKHAWDRMCERNFSFDAVEKILDFGRVLYTRGAIIFAIGKKEIELYKGDGVDLSDVDDCHIICSKSGEIVTMYRNQSFKKLKDWSRRGHKHTNLNKNQLAHYTTLNLTLS